MTTQAARPPTSVRSREAHPDSGMRTAMRRPAAAGPDEPAPRRRWAPRRRRAGDGTGAAAVAAGAAGGPEHLLPRVRWVLAWAVAVVVVGGLPLLLAPGG